MKAMPFEARNLSTLSSLRLCENLDQTVTPPKYHLACHDLLVEDVKANPVHAADWWEHIETPAGGYRPVPQALAFHKSPSRFRWALGGNRCLGPDTLIESPDGVSRPVSSIRGRHRVWAWDGSRRVEAVASEPWIKGWEPCYRVHLSSGQSFDCSAQHRVLTCHGYVAVGQLLESVPCRQETTSGIDPSGFRQDARHSTHRHGDWTDDSCSLSCGGRPEFGEGIEVWKSLQRGIAERRILAPFRSCSPQRLGGEPEHTFFGEVGCEDGQGNAEIVSYECIGIQPIYDFEVPGFGNYCAAGIVHHNSSKSHALCHEVYWHATGTHPFLPTTGGVQVWYATPTFELVGAIVWPKLKRLIGSNCTISWYNRAEDIPRSITIPTKDGPSKITFKAYEQGREVFQGTEMAFVAFDEQCPQDVFIEATSRIGANVSLKFAAALTPIDPQPWLEERLTSQRPDNWDVFEFPLDDNRISHGGFISDEQIDAMIEMWPPEVRETRRNGKWGSFLGTIYQTFDRQIHVVSEELEQRAFMRDGKIPEGSGIVSSIDWGGSNPFVHLWVSKIPHLDNDFYCFDEYYWNPKERGGRRLEEHADEIKARCAKWGITLARTWADHDPTDVLEFYHMGIPSMPAEKDRRPGIEAMRAAFNPRKNLSGPDWPQGRPRLHIAARCENTIREHAGYRWKPGTDRQDAPDEPLKLNDHTCDALRYLIYGEKAYEPMPDSPADTSRFRRQY